MSPEYIPVTLMRHAPKPWLADIIRNAQERFTSVGTALGDLVAAERALR